MISNSFSFSQPTSELSTFTVPFTSFTDIVVTVNPPIPPVSSLPSFSSIVLTPIFEGSFYSNQLGSFLVPVDVSSSLGPSLPSSSSPSAESVVLPGPSHSMRTRSQNGIFKPRHPLTLLTSLSSLPTKEPSHFSEAVHHHVWQKAMAEEYEALVKQGTWHLVPPPSHGNIIGCQPIYKIKKHSDGIVARHKARLVANGNQQELGMDFTETFSPFIKQPTLKVIFSLAVHHRWPLR